MSADDSLAAECCCFDAASMSSAIQVAMHDVQTNASLSAGSVSSLQLLQDGHLAVTDEQW